MKKMTAERWMKELEMFEKVSQAVQAKEKAQAAEDEGIKQDAEKRAWLRELNPVAEACPQTKVGNENGN